MSLQFEFPLGLSAEGFITKLSHEADAHLASRQTYCRTYYDSFDWRLYLNAITCELNQSKKPTSRSPLQYLLLRSIKTGLVIADAELKKVPPFCTEFEPGIMRDTLEPLLEMRALLPVCILD